MSVASVREERRREFLRKLQDEVTDVVHKRLIARYEGQNPVQLMEEELGRILLEVLKDED